MSNGVMVPSAEGYSVTVGGMVDPASEVEALVREYVSGNITREKALFRMWRLWRTGAYLDIVHEGTNEPVYPTWGSFVSEVLDAIGVSRSTVYSRLRVYSELEWLGFSEEEMLLMMVDRPSVIDRAINRIVRWSQRDGEVVDLRVDVGDGTADGVKSEVRSIIEEVAAHESPSEALGALDRYIGPSLSVKFVLRGTTLYVVSTQRGGNLVEPDIEYEVCDVGHIPGDVISELVRRYGIREE